MAHNGGGRKSKRPRKNPKGKTLKPRGKWFWLFPGIPKGYRVLMPGFHQMVKGRMAV